MKLSHSQKYKILEGNGVCSEMNVYCVKVQLYIITRKITRLFGNNISSSKLSVIKKR
jgi:hypothetical protein